MRCTAKEKIAAQQQQIVRCSAQKYWCQLFCEHFQMSCCSGTFWRRSSFFSLASHFPFRLSFVACSTCHSLTWYIYNEDKSHLHLLIILSEWLALHFSEPKLYQVKYEFVELGNAECSILRYNDEIDFSSYPCRS